MRTACISLLLAAMTVSGLPSPIQLLKRETPQERSHEHFVRATTILLQKNNPKNIVNSIFGLLGNIPARVGLGQVTNVFCLQQETADQAFTNAKATNDIDGMTTALVYRALERNTAAIGARSAKCPETAVNPEIAAIQQHRDPSGTTAAADNKAVTLELARQIAAIGGDPQIALQSGTFKPADGADISFKGNTCNDLNDAEGCIFTQKLLVEDATAAEIDAAVLEAQGGQAGLPA